MGSLSRQMQRYWPTLLLLAAIWGASYLFIKVALDDVEPAPMMAFRGLGAGLILFGYLAATIGAGRAYAELRESWRPLLVLGAINAALPFWLASQSGVAPRSLAAFTLAPARISRSALSPSSL